MRERPYRPSNGTEGMFFYENWCARCKRDSAYQADPDRAEGCPLIANSMAFDIGDPGYPVEWVSCDDVPRCTAFEDIGTPDRVERCQHTPDMFGPP